MDDILASLGGRISVSRVSVVRVASISFGGNVLVTISGELDMVSAFAVDEALAMVIGGPTATALEVDVSAVTYIDMSGLRCLVHAHRLAMEGVRPFTLLIGESGAVRRLLNFAQPQAFPKSLPAPITPPLD